jgi:alpha-tubulin suppressor-like RCC1 family protein
VTVTTARPTAPRLLATVLAGLILGGCTGTLYDEAGLPALAPGGTTCDFPQHVCGAGLGTCVGQTVAACGVDCQVCTATDPNATPSCVVGAGGAYGCAQACQAGFLPCAAGCCRAAAVSAGDDHACAQTSDGGLACWGKNDAGQLGPGAAGLTSSTRPIQVFTSGVTAVAAGGRSSCAVKDGTVQCWGANESGQLGNGTTAATTLVVSTGLTGATALAVGGRHACAVVGTGAAVRCWGANDHGQLGTGDKASHPSPVASLVTASATALSAAGDDTCAVAGGAASCWGYDAEGQTGFGADPTVPRPDRPTPRVVPLGGTAIGVAVGRKHACATASVGGGTPLLCWGSGGEGEMGDGATTTPVLSPVHATVIDNSTPGQTAVFTAGEAFTCGAKAGEVSLICNGRNDQEQCGVAPPSGTVTSRSDIGFGGTVVAVSAGRAFTCALVEVGGQVVKCWGINDAGQLGRATTPAASPSATPDLVGN